MLKKFTIAVITCFSLIMAFPQVVTANGVDNISESSTTDVTESEYNQIVSSLVKITPDELFNKIQK